VASWSPALVALQCGRLRSMMVPLCRRRMNILSFHAEDLCERFFEGAKSRKILRGAEGAQIAK
jgi:hypothetical protein